jgi:hypothetical protein
MGGMPRCTGDEIVPAFRQNFVIVMPDALMNGECGISATYSAVGELAGPNGPCHTEQIEAVFDRGEAKALESLSRALSGKTVEASKTR